MKTISSIVKLYEDDIRRGQSTSKGDERLSHKAFRSSCSPLIHTSGRFFRTEVFVWKDIARSRPPATAVCVGSDDIMISMKH